MRNTFSMVVEGWEGRAEDFWTCCDRQHERAFFFYRGHLILRRYKSYVEGRLGNEAVSAFPFLMTSIRYSDAITEALSDLDVWVSAGNSIVSRFHLGGVRLIHDWQVVYAPSLVELVAFSGDKTLWDGFDPEAEYMKAKEGACSLVNRRKREW